MKNAFVASILLFSSVLFIGHTDAQIVYQSATPGTPGVPGGYGLDADQFLGSRFTLSSATHIESIAGNISGTGTFFGAIVALSSPTALPLGNPFAGMEVLASGTFTASAVRDEVGLALSVTLGAGHYGVIFGSGRFGASGSGLMPSGDTGNGSVNIGLPTYFHWNHLFDGGQELWQDDGFGAVRFVVIGSTVAVPEPETYVMLLAGIGILGFIVCRRRQNAA